MMKQKNEFQLEDLRKLVREQQAMINILNPRMERIESFLNAFK